MGSLLCRSIVHAEGLRRKAEADGALLEIPPDQAEENKAT
jgi:hypothetical protein